MASMDIDDILAEFQADHGGGPVARGSASDMKLAQEDVRRLKQSWINERMNPEILPFEESLLERLMDRVHQQMEYIEENTINLENGSPDIKVKLLIVETELERIKYLIRVYLRMRLSKIDKYTMYIKTEKENSVISHLSEKEITYMERHHAVLKDLYKAQFLSALPDSLQRLDDTSGGQSMIEEPDLNSAAFIRVVNDVPYPVQAGTDRIELKKGNIYALRYSAVSSHIKAGDVEIV